MFNRSHIGISWSPDALTVAIQPTCRSARYLPRLIRAPLRPGDIDAVSGRIVNEQGLRCALQRAPELTTQSSKIASLAMAIPSAATYVHTWTEASAPREYSPKELSLQVESVLPAKGDELVFDIQQRWSAVDGITRAMMIVANRDVVLGYTRLLGSHVGFLKQTTTAEIARYNLCCLIDPKFCDVPSVVVQATAEYIELTAWTNGVIRCSRRMLLVDPRMHAPRDGDESIGAMNNHGRDNPYVIEFTAALSSVLSHFNEAERAECRIVALSSRIIPKVRSALHSLSFNKIPVDYLSFSEALAQIWLGERSPAQLKTVESEGSEDALGALLSDPSRSRLARGGKGGALGLVCSMWGGMHQRSSVSAQSIGSEGQ